MSSLWTPGGERPVPPPSGGAPPPGPKAGPGPAEKEAEQEDEEELSPDDMARLSELRRQLAEAPAWAVVANHCFGLFELAALHLSLKPPKLDQARLAIDALGYLVDGLAGRLGDQEGALRDGLAQLRLAYVQIESAMGPAARSGDGDEAATQPSD